MGRILKVFRFLADTILWIGRGVRLARGRERGKPRLATNPGPGLGPGDQVEPGEQVEPRQLGHDRPLADLPKDDGGVNLTPPVVAGEPGASGGGGGLGILPDLVSVRAVRGKPPADDGDGLRRKAGG